MKNRCTFCGGDATVSVTSWTDIKANKEYYKKGERACMKCHKQITGIKFF